MCYVSTLLCLLQCWRWGSGLLLCCAILYCAVLCRERKAACTRLHAHTYSHIYTCAHTHTHIHTCTCTCNTRTHTRTHTWAYTHVHSHMSVYTHTHIRARPTRHRVLFIGSFLLLLLFLVSWDCFACFLPVWTLLKTLPKLSLYISSKLKLGNKKLSSFSASCFPLFPPF